MKFSPVVFVLFLMSLSSVAMAQESSVAACSVEATPIEGYLVSPCTNWIPNYQGNGFVCTSFERRLALADYYTVTARIQELEARIAVLEKKLGEVQP